ncbi:hypothetical protein ACFL27_01025 [candidate division CSSED10-310 bacterium]|uniref:Uncharacterized protein n=1 Tax=candidate division CSSED10-310 bacterium TaxID=2855610 RepID=A0ABV6YRC7_UNCC1
MTMEQQDDHQYGASTKPLVNTNSLREEGDTNTCLRPLGLCELGGCCDVCWYGPNSPQNKTKPPRGSVEQQ